MQNNLINKVKLWGIVYAAGVDVFTLSHANVRFWLHNANAYA